MIYKRPKTQMNHQTQKTSKTLFHIPWNWFYYWEFRGDQNTVEMRVRNKGRETEKKLSSTIARTRMRTLFRVLAKTRLYRKTWFNFLHKQGKKRMSWTCQYLYTSVSLYIGSLTVQELNRWCFKIWGFLFS